MTPEEKQLLEKTYDLAKENNALLRSLKKHAQWGTAGKIAYWTIIVLISFGALFLIQPYIDMIKGLTGAGSSTPNSSGSYADLMQDLLK